MLQSLFVIYKDMMIQTHHIVQYKKINVNKVSDSFDTCRSLCMITLEELERVEVDIFISEDANGLEGCGPT